MSKTLYPKSKLSFNLSLLAIVIMVLNLFAAVKWLMIVGLFTSFLFALLAIISGIINLRFVYKNEDKYRGDSMCWIAICLGTIVLLSDFPFIYTVLVNTEWLPCNRN